MMKLTREEAITEAKQAAKTGSFGAFVVENETDGTFYVESSPVDNKEGHKTILKVWPDGEVIRWNAY